MATYNGYISSNQNKPTSVKGDIKKKTKVYLKVDSLRATAYLLDPLQCENCEGTGTGLNEATGMPDYCNVCDGVGTETYDDTYQIQEYWIPGHLQPTRLDLQIMDQLKESRQIELPFGKYEVRPVNWGGGIKRK